MASSARVGRSRLLRYIIYATGTSAISYVGYKLYLSNSRSSRLRAETCSPGDLNCKMPTPLTSKFLPSRAEQIASLRDSKKVYDVLVVGGGATGCGVALDAVTRGLSTALVELDDFASGTSSRSTKLIHGGVR